MGNAGKKSGIILLLLFCLGGSLFGQGLSLNGDAQSLGGNCFLVTPDTAWQLGSVWSPDTLNLNRPFVFVFTANFGGDDAGADGLVFALQNSGPSVIGASGEGMGYLNIPNSLGIEFDTFQNMNQGDPGYDHLGIHINGSVNHNSPNQIAGPVIAVPGVLNIEDSLDHTFEVSWNPATELIRVSFDCQPRLQANIDLVNQVFAGDTLVRWGYTAATGGFYNAHSVCLDLAQSSVVADPNPNICVGDTVQLGVFPSADSNYAWSPNLFMDDSTLQSPTVWPDSSTTYFVSYLNQCGQLLTDSFEVTVSPVPLPDLGPDTSFCPGTSIFLDPDPANQFPSAGISWSLGGNSPTQIIKQAGLIWVELNQNGCSGRDSVLISQGAEPVLELGPDQYICPGDTLPICAGDTLSNYTWSTGATSPCIDLTQAGTYTLLKDSGGCQIADTLQVLPGLPPLPGIPADTLSCNPDTVLLIGSNPLLSYIWSTGDNGDTAFVQDSGWVYVSYAEGNCQGFDSTYVRFFQEPVADLGPDIAHCGGAPEYLLDAGVNSGQILWSTGETTAQITARDSGWFSVQVQHACGTEEDSLLISVSDQRSFIPNVFTPNQDGFLDEFRVETPNSDQYFLEIYDRWGTSMFFTENPTEGWDGRFSGIEKPPGVYYFRVKTLDCKDREVHKTGHLTLVR